MVLAGNVLGKRNQAITLHREWIDIKSAFWSLLQDVEKVMFEWLMETVLVRIWVVSVEIFVRVMILGVFYYIGWPIVKVLTLGGYPKSRREGGVIARRTSDEVTGLIGLLVTIIVVVQWLTW